MTISQIPSSRSLTCKSEQNKFYYLLVQLSINHRVPSSDISSHKCLIHLCYLFCSEFLILYSDHWTSWARCVHFPRRVLCGNTVLLIVTFRLGCRLHSEQLCLADFLINEHFACPLLNFYGIGLCKEVLGPPCILGMILNVLNYSP